MHSIHIMAGQVTAAQKKGKGKNTTDSMLDIVWGKGFISQSQLQIQNSRTMSTSTNFMGLHTTSHLSPPSVTRGDSHLVWRAQCETCSLSLDLRGQMIYYGLMSGGGDFANLHHQFVHVAFSPNG